MTNVDLYTSKLQYCPIGMGHNPSLGLSHLLKSLNNIYFKNTYAIECKKTFSLCFPPVEGAKYHSGSFHKHT